MVVTLELCHHGYAGNVEPVHVHQRIDRLLQVDLFTDEFFGRQFAGLHHVQHGAVAVRLHAVAAQNFKLKGNDVGTQYRSAMFYKDEEQKELFAQAIERAKGIWGSAVVTELSPATTFWTGEEYHQDFFAKNPNQGYCNAVVSPKMAKARKAFSDYVLN